MKVFKTRNVKTPLRAHSTDAGIDFFVPEFDSEFRSDFNKKNDATSIFSRCSLGVDTIKVLPGGNVLIPTGVKVVVPQGFALIAFNKSGVASKTGFLVGAAVVDESYRGEVHINVINTSTKDREITPGMKLMQFILIPVGNEGVEEVTEIEYALFSNTDRGEGGFGSTGNN